MKLYHHPLSGHAHRAHLFLSLAGIPHELVLVDLAKSEHKSEAFLSLNRFGEVPVLVDEDITVPDSIAIMVYAARKFGKAGWFPEGPAEAAAVQRWLSVSAGQIFNGPCVARLITVFRAAFDAREAIERSHAILKVIDAELSGRDWIATAHPSAADVALYSYIANAPEGNVDLSAYDNVLSWLSRVEALPGFVPFQQSRAGLRA